LHLLKTKVPEDEIKGALYFSDHGEEVDDPDCIGHAPECLTRNKIEIPLILWLSKEYQQRNPIEYQALLKHTGHPITIEHLNHSIIDFIGLQSALTDPLKSLFNPAFQGHKRMIYARDYDAFIKQGGSNFQTWVNEVK
jgi:heptose-I-phosphate ethanolaminephosphotransferase